MTRKTLYALQPHTDEAVQNIDVTITSDGKVSLEHAYEEGSGIQMTVSEWDAVVSLVADGLNAYEILSMALDKQSSN